jgi:uncharacterized lipoprotein YajG
MMHVIKQNATFQKTIHFLLRTKNIALLMVAVGSLSGCALTQDHIGLTYVRQQNVEKIQGAEAVKAKVLVTDGRAIKDKVSAKKNGYGMEMASIIATNDVSYLFKTAIEDELSSRGFTLAEGNLVVGVEVGKFYNDFKIGFWAGDAVAELAMNIQVTTKEGTIVFVKSIAAEGKNANIQLCTGSNAKTALDLALKEGVAKLFADKTFMDALMKTVPK